MIRHAEHLHGLDLWVLHKKILDLTRIDVFTAANEHVLESPDDRAITLIIDCCDIARMHPARWIDRLSTPFDIFPIAPHHAIAAGAQLSGHADASHVAGRIDNLDRDVGMDTADRTDPPLNRIVVRDWNESGLVSVMP